MVHRKQLEVTVAFRFSVRSFVCIIISGVRHTRKKTVQTTMAYSGNLTSLLYIGPKLPNISF